MSGLPPPGIRHFFTGRRVRNEMTLGYQHLVVDRGSIGAYDVLFER